MKRPGLYIAIVTVLLTSYTIAAPAPIFHWTQGEGKLGLGAVKAGAGVLTIDDDAGPVRIHLADAVRGEAGCVLPLPKLFWFNMGHFWRVEIDGTANLTAGCVRLIMRSVDEQGKTISEFEMEQLTPGHASQRWVYPLVWLAPAGADHESTAADAFLRLAIEGAEGDLTLRELKITKYHMPAAERARWQETGPTVFGGLPWIDPSYVPEGSTPPLLRDTGHKLLVAAGIDRMRYMLLWGHWKKLSANSGRSIEKDKGVFDFSTVDAHLDEMAYYGIKVGMMTVHGSPDWVSSKTAADLPEHKRKNSRLLKSLNFAPDDWRDYENFVRRMVQRYGDRVESWEVWNEPDSPDHGPSEGLAAYKEYLKRFYTIAKEVDPDAVVLCGRVGRWLPFLMQEGYDKYMDGICPHPYPGREGPVERSVGIMRDYQIAQVAFGVHKPLVVSEVGYGGSYPWPGPGGQRNEQAKAALVREALPKLAEMTSEIYWYAPIMPDRWYGFIKAEKDRYRPMPALRAVGEVTGRLSAEGGPVKVEVQLPEIPIARGESTTIALRAVNTSTKPQDIRFWPVGFVPDLGQTFAGVRALDHAGILQPGQTREATVTVTPVETAQGRYPLGLAVICAEGNSLALEDIWIDCLAVQARPSTSHQGAGTNASALNDLSDPVWSFDESTKWLSWLGHKGTQEWMQYDFTDLQSITAVEVYWLDDTKPKFGFDKVSYDCYRTPASYRVLYRRGDEWREVNGVAEYPTERNRFNRVQFDAVTTDALRVEVQLREGYSGGVYEWRVE